MNWKSIKIKEFGRIITGKTPSSNNPEQFGSDYPFITPTEITGNRIVYTKRGISKQGYLKYNQLILPPKSVCVVCIGATIGKICLTTKHSLTNQQINSIIVDNDRHDALFVYYLLSLFPDRIKSIAGGAATPIVNKSTFENVSVVAPPLPTQRRIASILSAYDDLIENNLRRIEILEEMAQNLYREWFVKFRFPGHEQVRFVDSEMGRIPEGWEWVSLGDILEAKRGKTITKKTIKRGNVPVVAGGLQPAYFHNKSNTNNPVITISASGANAGFVNLYHKSVWASDCSYIDSSETPYVYYFFLLLKHRQTEITRMQRGAAQPHVYPKDLARLSVFKVPDVILCLFDQQITPVFELVSSLSSKNKNLRHTRDLLLPRLISGEVDVSDLDISLPKNDVL